MELRHLVTFRTIVDEGGFKKAADELGYAQSSITAHIKELEKELGYPLFDRLGKTITLTEPGKRFVPYALEIIELYSKSKEVIMEENEPTGQLTIGASESIMIYWLPSMIMEFMDKYPKVELILKSIDYKHLSNQLKKGEIDVAILVENSDWDPKDLVSEKIQEEKLIMVESSKDPKINTMLFTEYSCSWRPIFEDYLYEEGKANSLRLELPSVEAIKKCVLCGLGKSMLPHFTVKNEVENGELNVTNLDVPKNPIAIYSAIHKNKWRSINVITFLDHLIHLTNPIE